MLLYVRPDGTAFYAKKFRVKSNHLSVPPHGYSLDGTNLFSAGGTGMQQRAVAISKDERSIGFVYQGGNKEDAEARVYYFAPHAVEWWDRELSQCEARVRVRNEAKERWKKLREDPSKTAP
jgi:hypothetical protein